MGIELEQNSQSKSVKGMRASKGCLLRMRSFKEHDYNQPTSVHGTRISHLPRLKAMKEHWLKLESGKCKLEANKWFFSELSDDHVLE